MLPILRYFQRTGDHYSTAHVEMGGWLRSGGVTRGWSICSNCDSRGGSIEDWRSPVSHNCGWGWLAQLSAVHDGPKLAWMPAFGGKIVGASCVMVLVAVPLWKR